MSKATLNHKFQISLPLPFNAANLEESSSVINGMKGCSNLQGCYQKFAKLNFQLNHLFGLASSEF